MSDHTPEPWTFEKRNMVKDANGQIVLSSGIAQSLGVPSKIAEINTARIVACVNACAGIPTEALEGASVKALVDGLITAREYVQSVHGTIESAQGHDRTIVKPDLDKIDAALAPFLKGDTDET